MVIRTFIASIICSTLQTAGRTTLTDVRLQRLMDDIVPIHAHITVSYIMAFVAVGYADLAYSSIEEVHHRALVASLVARTVQAVFHARRAGSDYMIQVIA